MVFIYTYFELTSNFSMVWIQLPLSKTSPYYIIFTSRFYMNPKIAFLIADKGIYFCINVFHRVGFCWLNKTIIVMPAFRSAMVCLRKFFCIKDLCLHFKDSHRKNLKTENCVKECQLNRAKPRELKDNSCKLSKNQR